MDKITYTRGTYSNEAQKVEMEIKEDLSIWDFKTLCKRLAYSLGYSSKSVEEAFGGKPKTPTSDKIKQILFDGKDDQAKV